MYCIKLAAWRQILVKTKLHMDHFVIWNPGKGDFVPKLFPHLDGFSRRFVLSMGKPRLRGKDTLSFPNPPLLAECAVRQKLYSARRGRTCSQKSEKQYISLLLPLREKVVIYQEIQISKGREVEETWGLSFLSPSWRLRALHLMLSIHLGSC